MDKNDQNQIQIELPEDIAQGIYSNLVIVGHSSSEFIIDFIRVLPGLTKASVKSRIILSPEHAKRMMMALTENVKRYEQLYGAINTDAVVVSDNYRSGGDA